MLRPSNHQVEFAGDGTEAIECLDGAEYDVVLLDLMMPNASGFEVLAWMHRKKPRFAKRGVIVLTAMPERDLKNLTQDRVFAVIRKPFDIDELAAKIDDCLSPSR